MNVYKYKKNGNYIVDSCDGKSVMLLKVPNQYQIVKLDYLHTEDTGLEEVKDEREKLMIINIAQGQV